MYKDGDCLSETFELQVEDINVGDVVGVLQAHDEDTNESFTYSIEGTGQFFELKGNNVTLKQVDFDSTKSPNFKIFFHVQDSGGLRFPIVGSAVRAVKIKFPPCAARDPFFIAPELNVNRYQQYEYTTSNYALPSQMYFSTDNSIMGDKLIFRIRSPRSLTIEANVSFGTFDDEFNASTYFDGIAGASIIGSDDLPFGNSKYTISVWVKAETVGNMGIVGWGNAEVYNKYTGIALNLGETINISWGGSNAFSAQIGDIVGHWTHIISSYNGSFRFIFVNGKLVAQDEPQVAHDVEKPSLGFVGSIGNTSFFKGHIDELAIWSKALNFDEISMLQLYDSCDAQENPRICISSCDGSLYVPDHYKWDFEGLPKAERQLLSKLKSSKPVPNDEIV